MYMASSKLSDAVTLSSVWRAEMKLLNPWLFITNLSCAEGRAY